MTQSKRFTGTWRMSRPANAARHLAACIAILLLPQISIAGPFSPQGSVTDPASDTVQDYSHSLPLNVSGKQGVVSFRLPQAVYLHARSASLNDLRLFDTSGSPVPFALHVPPAQQHIQRDRFTVRVFPLTSSRSTMPGDIALDVRRAADGTLVSIRTRPGKDAADTKGDDETTQLVGLVLDMRQDEHASSASDKPLINALHFSLPDKVSSYSAHLSLEVSDDLKQWDTVANTELNWLVNRDTQMLANDRMEFEPRHFRYARLTWRSGEPLQFETITAETIQQTGEAPTFETLLLAPNAGKEEHDLVYRAAIAIPVEKIGLQFDEPNVVMPAALGSYHEVTSRKHGRSGKTFFQSHVRANFYRIVQQGEQRQSGDISIPVTHLTDWVVRPEVVTTAKPQLRLSWRPATLVFLSSGTGPYTLAFGRDKIKPVRLTISQVAPGFSVQELRNLEQASAGTLQEHETPALQDQGLATSSNVRVGILWGVLLLGVAVLAVLARKLIKQME